MFSLCRFSAVLLVNQVYEGHLSRHAAVHDAVVDLHGGDDREGHSV